MRVRRCVRRRVRRRLRRPIHFDVLILTERGTGVAGLRDVGAMINHATVARQRVYDYQITLTEQFLRGIDFSDQPRSIDARSSRHTQ